MRKYRGGLYVLALIVGSYVVWRYDLLDRVRALKAEKEAPLPGKVQGTSRVKNTVRIVTGLDKAPRWSGITGAPGPLQPAPPVVISRRNRRRNA